MTAYSGFVLEQITDTYQPILHKHVSLCSIYFQPFPKIVEILIGKSCTAWMLPTFLSNKRLILASQIFGSFPARAAMRTEPHFSTNVLPVHKIGPDWPIHTFFSSPLPPLFSLKWELLLGGSGQFYVGAGNKNQYLIICELSVSLHL